MDVNHATSLSDYLGDDNIVFGLEINGDMRAYPKRIPGNPFQDLIYTYDDVGNITRLR